MEWTDDRVELLKALWKDGLSATQIARRLGGVSRNAVLGKLYRSGLLKTRAKPSAPTRLPPRPKRVKSEKGARLVIAGCGAVLQLPPSPPPKAKPPEPAPLAGTEPKHWLERLAGECAFPVSGDGADTFSCCAPVADGAYCKAHHAVIFVKPARKREPKRRNDWSWAEQRRRWAA